MWKVYVGNLHSRIRERELADKFRAYGVVRSVWVARNPPGYAFIEFDTRQEADDAISALDGKHGWRVEMSRRSARGRDNRSHSSESRCHECGSSGHHTKDCRSGASEKSHRQSSSPRPRSIILRCDSPRKRERSRSPKHYCSESPQNDQDSSHANGLSPARNERSRSRSPQPESSPEN